jgi:hypothetical protein
MMLTFDQPVPDFELGSEQILYLLVDGGLIDGMLPSLYQVDGPIVLEPIYMLEPYDQLREVSPCVVQVTPEIQTWFIEQNVPIAGFFFASTLSLDVVCDHLRRCITVISPYGSDVLLKMAHAETAWVLLDNDVAHFWQVIEQAWLPTRLGWKHQLRRLEPATELDWPLAITDRIWAQFGQISWLTTLETLTAHINQFFPAMVANHDSLDEPFDVWLNATALEGYQRGFTSERDLMLYFNIIGFLGETAVTSDDYPEIHQLITKPSLHTPSQRIEQAAELAYHLSQTPKTPSIQQEQSA